MVRNLLLLLFLLLSLFGNGQVSCLLKDYNIADDRLAAIPIIVSGATTNLTNDKLCNITIKFTHESINQLRISLVSPSGQRLNILGPGTSPSNPSFPPIEYNVSFVQCMQAPVPDIGYSSRWDNEQVWFGPTISGSYHPFQGCLEDLNIGNINGTWILEIEDVAAIDKGIIECLNFEFCTSKNINTQFCNTNVGQLVIASDSYCENQVYDLRPITRFPNGQSPASTYDNLYAISNGTLLVDYVSTNIAKGLLPPGNYTVCQFSVFKTDAPSLPTPGSIMAGGDFGSEFARLGLCGAVSNCIDLIVKPITDSVAVNPSPICIGSSYVFRGRSFDTAGTYYVEVPNIDANLCDTVFIINLPVLDITPQINADNPRLACNLFAITLTADNPLLSDSARYTWSTPNGNIIYTNADTIRVDKIGIYNVSVIDQGCSSDATFEVLYDPSAPVISVTSDTITCDKPNATVTVISTGIITDTEWTSGGNKIGINQLEIGSPGPVNGFVIHNDGCRVPIPTITVRIDTVTTRPAIVAMPSAFDCVRRSSSFTIGNANLFRNTLEYFFQNPVTGNSEQVLFPDNIVNTGTYRVDAIMARNGCPVSQSITLNDTSYTPIVSLETFCRGNEVWVRGVTDRPAGPMVWNGPNGPVGFDNNSLEQRVDEDGVYVLSFTSRSGCVAPDVNLPIVISTQFPNFVVPDDSISCLINTVQLRPGQVQGDAIYSWTGPFNFTANTPTIDATAIGTYIGTARKANGCQTIDTVNVSLYVTDADPSFAPDIIVDCSRDTILLTPTDLMTYDYIWQTALSPPIITPANVAIAEVQQPGTYRVIAKDKTSGCEIKVEVQVGDERDLPVLDSVTTKKTCALNSHASIAISADSLFKVREISWAGPMGYVSNAFRIDNLAEGTYTFRLTTQKGCNLRDTFQITHDVVLPIITTALFDTINCSGNFSKTITANSDGPGDNFLWLAGSVILSQTRNVLINRQNFNTNNSNGVFSVIARRTSNGCESPPTIVQLAWDTLAASINLNPVDITCIEPRPTISFESDRTVLFALWKKNGVITANNTQSFLISQPGIYSFVSTDNRRCIVSDSMLIEDLRDSVMYTIESELVGCEGGIISLIDTQNIMGLLWSGPEAISQDTVYATIQTPGVYTFDMITPLGCIYTDSVVIGEDKVSPLIQNRISDTLTCNRIAVDINFQADKVIKEIKWFSDGVDTITTKGALNVGAIGRYFAIIVADNNCVTFDSVDVFQDTIKPSLHLVTDSLVCSRSFARIRVDSSSVIRNYEWKGPDGFAAVTRDVNATLPGIYQLQAFGFNGCDTTLFTEVRDVKRIPALTLPDSLFIPCNGDSALVNVVSDQPIRLYRWTSTTAVLSTSDTLSTTQIGKVFLNVLSTENCQSQDSIILLRDMRITNAVVSGNNIFCEPDTSFLEAVITTDNINFWWLRPDGMRVDSVTTLASTLPGTYSFIVERSLFCFDTFDIEISIDIAVPNIVLLEQDSPLLCKNTSVQILSTVAHSMPNRLQYFWNLNGNLHSIRDSNIAVTNAGTYMLLVRDSINHCIDSMNITIAQEQSSLVNFDVFPTAPTCFGEADGQLALQNVLGGVGPYQITINRPGNTINDSLIAGLEARQYIVTLEDRWGCQQTKSVLIPNGLFFDATLPADTSIRLGEEISVNYETSLASGLIGMISFIYNGETICTNCASADFSPLFSGKLIIEIESETGCLAYDTMEIFVAETIDWLFPNVITPSNDNNIFSLPENLGVDKVEEVSIYDRWGNLVYSRSDLIPGDAANGWDGTHQGRELTPGVYAVYVRALLKNGKIFQTTRDITLLK